MPGVCVKVKRDVRGGRQDEMLGGGEPRPGGRAEPGPCQRRGRGARGAADGREGAAAGGALRPSRPGRGGGGEPGARGRTAAAPTRARP